MTIEALKRNQPRLGLDSILGSSPGFPEEYWESFIKTVPQTYHGLGRRGQTLAWGRSQGMGLCRTSIGLWVKTKGTILVGRCTTNFSLF